MNKNDIESIVPLLPMQQNFLWHSLADNAQSSVIQLRCTFSGTINSDLLESAWHKTVEQHQALRSSVHWKDIAVPLQITHKRVQRSIVFLENDNDTVLEEYLQWDKSNPIDLTQAPSFRLAILCRDQQTCDVVWSMSHVLLDGWSSTVVLNTWVQIYTEMLSGSTLQSNNVLQLSDYTQWIKRQDSALLQQYWHEYLPESFNSAPLPFREHLANGQINKENVSRHATMSVEKFAQLKHSIQSAGVSLGTILQAAFGTTLHNKNSTDPIVFATTVSGRQTDIAHMEQRVGMFMNVVPVSVGFDEGESIINWLLELQTSLFTSLAYAHASTVQTALLRPQKTSLYDSLLIIENQPVALSTDALSVSNYRSAIISEFEITLVVIPAEELQLEILYDSRKFLQHNIDRLLETLLDILNSLPGMFEQNVQALDPFKAADFVPSNASCNTKLSDKVASCQKNQNRLNEAEVTMLEQSLNSIWSRVLNNQEIQQTENFFDLGGTSIQAVLIFEQIQKTLDIQLPATALFSAPTINKLAMLIQCEQPNSLWASIVAINSSGTKPPLFIPFEQADMLMYQPLIAELGTDQPVYGLMVSHGQYPSIEMLERLADHIERVHPNGPCRLAGLSGAGLIAWDVAQRLTARGREVDMLALFDTYGPDYPRLAPPLSRLAAICSRVLWQSILWGKTRLIRFIKPADSSTDMKLESLAVRQHTASEKRTLFSLGFRRRINEETQIATSFVNEISSEITQPAKCINHIILRLCCWRVLSNALRIEFIVLTQGLLLEYCKTLTECVNSKTGAHPIPNKHSFATGIMKLDPNLLQASKPAAKHMLDKFQAMYCNLMPYKGDVLYFKAVQRPAGVTDDPLVGWTNLLQGKVTVTPIPGNHTSLLKKPNVQILARSLAGEIARLESRNEPV